MLSHSVFLAVTWDFYLSGRAGNLLSSSFWFWVEQVDVFSSLCRNQRERVRSREAADQTVKMRRRKLMCCDDVTACCPRCSQYKCGSRRTRAAWCEQRGSCGSALLFYYMLLIWGKNFSIFTKTTVFSIKTCVTVNVVSLNVSILCLDDFTRSLTK